MPPNKMGSFALAKGAVEIWGECEMNTIIFLNIFYRLYVTLLV
jgi:hypothetical protein